MGVEKEKIRVFFTEKAYEVLTQSQMAFHLKCAILVKLIRN